MMTSGLREFLKCSFKKFYGLMQCTVVLAARSIEVTSTRKILGSKLIAGESTL
jgi:hypothetical protein